MAADMTKHRQAAGPDNGETVNRAMVMAAGLGRRMRPLTDDVPKPLVRLCGRPLIDYAIDRLIGAGIGTIVVNVHYLADAVERHLAGRGDIEVVISDERDHLLDTGGGAARVLETLGPGPFFVINSDSVWLEGIGAGLARMRRRWNDAEMDCLILLASTVTSVGYGGRGDFHMDVSGRLMRRPETEVAPFVNTGAYLIHPRLFTDLPDGAFSMNLLWDRAIGAERLFGIRHDGVWMHVGTPEALNQAERLMSGRF